MYDYIIRRGESIIVETKGDYWCKRSFLGFTKITGYYVVTDQRIIFQSSTSDPQLRKKFEIQLMDIKNIKSCKVGSLIRLSPDGIEIYKNNSETYILAFVDRDKYLKLIIELIKEVLIMRLLRAIKLVKPEEIVLH
jgi:hypothetical protein